MNSLIRGLLAFWAVAICAGPAFAVSDTNREMARTYVNFYIQQGEYESAQKFLSEHLRADSEDAGGWNLLGLSFIRTRAYEKAVHSFFRAVSFAGKDDPDRPIFMYHYADALARTGDLSKAENVLNQIRNEELVASRVEEALASLEPRRPLPELAFASNIKFQATLSLSTGYDSNVLLTSDDSLATVDVSETASPFVIPAVQAAWEFPAFDGVGGINALGAFTYQTSDHAQRFNTLYSSLELGWAPAAEVGRRVSWRAYEDTDVSFVNEDGFGLFNATQTLGWQLIISHSALARTELTIPGRFLFYPLGDEENEENDRSGPSLRPAIAHRRQLGNVLLEFGFAYDRHFARGDNYVANTYTLPVSAQVPLFSGTSGKFYFEPSLLHYPDNEDARRDTVLETGVQLMRVISGRTYGAVDVGFRRNISNVNEATYSKFTGSLMVGYQL